MLEPECTLLTILHALQSVYIPQPAQVLMLQASPCEQQNKSIPKRAPSWCLDVPLFVEIWTMKSGVKVKAKVDDPPRVTV
jgi:hypothetical protein